MTRRYLCKLARRLNVVVTPKAPVTVRPGADPVVDVPLVLGALAVVGVLMVVGGWL